MTKKNQDCGEAILIHFEFRLFQMTVLGT